MCRHKAIPQLVKTLLVIISSITFVYTASAEVVVDYTYDDLNRLVDVTRDDGPLVTYEYDEMGNLTSLVVANSPDTDGDQIADFADTDADMDSDGDGIFDNNDNCTLVSNLNQRDTDGDQYGNMCDADFNGDNQTNTPDLTYFKTHFFTSDPDADLNGDGLVNTFDLTIFKQLFFKPPGPSGTVE